jgi:hypothetical protein
MHVLLPDGTAAVRVFVGPKRPEMFALVIDISGSTFHESNIPGHTIIDLECAVACSIIACLPPGTVVTVILFDRNTYHVQKPIAIPLDDKLTPQELMDMISCLAIIDDNSIDDRRKLQKIAQARWFEVDDARTRNPKKVLKDIAARLHDVVRVSLMYKIMCSANASDGLQTYGYTAIGNSQDFFTITQHAHIIFLGDGEFNDNQDKCRWSALSNMTFHFLVFRGKSESHMSGMSNMRMYGGVTESSGFDKLLRMANKLAPGHVHVPADMEGIAAAITAILSRCREVIHLEDLRVYWTDDHLAVKANMPEQAHENVPFTIKVISREDAQVNRNMRITYPRDGMLMQVDVSCSGNAKPTYYTSDIDAVCTELSRVQLGDKKAGVVLSNEEVATTMQQAKMWFRLCYNIRALHKLDVCPRYKDVRGKSVTEAISVKLKANTQLNVELSAKWTRGGQAAEDALKEVVDAQIDLQLVKEWEDYNVALQNVSQSDDIPEMPGEVHRYHTDIITTLENASCLISCKVTLGVPGSKEEAYALTKYTNEVANGWAGCIQNALWERCQEVHHDVMTKPVIIDASKQPCREDITARIKASADALSIPQFSACSLRGNSATEVLYNMLSDLADHRDEIDNLLLSAKPNPSAMQYKRRKIVHNAATSVVENPRDRGASEHYQLLRGILDHPHGKQVYGTNMPLAPVDHEVPIPPDYAPPTVVRWGILMSSPARALPTKPVVTLTEHYDIVKVEAIALLNEPRRLEFPADNPDYYIMDARDCRSVSILTDILTGEISAYSVVRSADKSKLGLDFEGIGVWSTSYESVLMLIKGNNDKEFNVTANTYYYPISGSDYQYVELASA